MGLGLGLGMGLGLRLGLGLGLGVGCASSTMVFCRLKMPEHLPSLLTLLCSLESWVGLGL